MTFPANYDDVLDQMQAAGLVFESRDLPLDTSRMRRVKVEGDRERRGWYILHELPLDEGGQLLVGSFGIWQGQNNNAQKVELRKREFTAEQKAAMKARLADDRKRAEAARKREAERAAARASSAWAKCKPTWVPEGGVEMGSCSYLLRKGVKAHGTRFTDTGALVVPMMDNQSRIHGLQFILGKDTHADRIKKTGRDKEYWPLGLVKQGHYFIHGSPDVAGIVLVGEGYATMASLHEATGLPFAVAFDAGNLQPVGEQLRKRYKSARILFCADEDAYGKCPSCKKLTPQPADTCAHCGADTKILQNAGVTRADLAALAVPNSATLKPHFTDSETRRAAAMERGEKITDFNDLHAIEGLASVTSQVEARLHALGWTTKAPAARSPSAGGAGKQDEMVSRLTVDEAVQRYWGTYGLGGDVLFDEAERRLVHKKDVINLLPRHGWDQLKEHSLWRVVRDTEIGFDPTERDPQIKANLFGGWPTTPKQGECGALLTLLRTLCSGESNSDELYHWVIKHLAYPIQHRGAKMQSAIVVHGPQGTGKSIFFEAYAKIFGPYGRVLGQEALEDKFNADWAEKKLFILADEILARQDMFHIKNRLKGFITGDTIRVNPKNIAAHNEKNQMNIVFLSNERMPLVLENDDRRHCVIYVPPKRDDQYYEDIATEIENGGIEALHHFLLNLDLGDFKPWTKPPMTRSKEELIDLCRSCEERFVNDWLAGDAESPTHKPLPVCPCKGSHLYKAYEHWCEEHGERKRGAKDLISYIGKLPGWRAGQSLPTLETLASQKIKNRKMVVPPEKSELLGQHKRHDTQKMGEWLTAGFFAFAGAMDLDE